MLDLMEPIVTVETKEATQSQLNPGFFRVIQGWRKHIAAEWKSLEVFKDESYEVCDEWARKNCKDDVFKNPPIPPESYLFAYSIIAPNGEYIRNPDCYPNGY